MAYKYHPEIEGLKTNEKGTEILLNGSPLVIKKINRKSRPSDTLYVIVNGKNFTVAKLVCECWNGMAENPRWVATRKVKEKGFHYKNLIWTPKGKNPAMGTNKVSRSRLSKITDLDVKAIKKRLKKGDTLKAIAQDYNTSDMSISRIKKQM